MKALPLKCPWCGKLAEIHNGRLRRHIVWKGVQCVGGGFTRETVEQLQHGPSPLQPQRKKKKR